MSSVLTSSTVALSSKQAHILPLDGIRGLAILLVIAEHGTVNTVMSTRVTEWIRKLMEAGWIGVDLFFVLSGFLITGILLKAKPGPAYFKNFYARRLLRIWPLYLAAATVALIVVPLLLSTAGISDPALDLVRSKQQYVWLHCVNFGLYFYPAVFRASNSVGFAQFWSLAVEEHFYLVWPLAIWLVSMSTLKKLCVGLFVAAFVLRVIGVALGANVYYFTLTFCRFDSLALGAFLAAFAHEGQLVRLLKPALCVGPIAASLLLAFLVVKKGFWVWDPVMFTIGLSLIAAAFGSLLIVTLHGPRLLRAVFSTPALVMFAKYSYGWYVIDGLVGGKVDNWLPWRRLAYLTGSIEGGALIFLLIKGAVSFFLAVVVWHTLEDPILRLKKYFSTNAPQPASNPRYTQLTLGRD